MCGYTVSFFLLYSVHSVYKGVFLFCIFLFQRGKLNHIPLVKQSQVEPGNFLILVVVSMVFIVLVLGMSGALYCLRHRSHHKLKEKLAGLGNDTGHDATAAYQVRAGRWFQPITLHLCTLAWQSFPVFKIYLTNCPVPRLFHLQLFNSNIFVIIGRYIEGV